MITETKPATYPAAAAGSSVSLRLRSEAFHWNDQTLAQCTAPLPRMRSLEENAKWISRTFCLHIFIVVSELIGNSKEFLHFLKFTCTARQPLTKMHHFEKGEELWDASKVTGLTSYWPDWASDWPQVSAFVQLSSHPGWQGIREHILPMYLLLSSHQETDYKNPQKTLHIYISVCHNSLGLGPSFYKSHRNLFSWCPQHLLSS